METTILEGPMTRGRPRKLQEKSLLTTRSTTVEGLNKALMEFPSKLAYHLQVETLSREKEEQNGHSLYESGASQDEENMSMHSVSSRSHRSERHERHERYGRHKRHREEPRREEIDGMKCKIPPYLGESKPYSYVKVKLVTLKFNDYPLMWWNQILCNIRRIRRLIVETWAELKRDLKERFVPSYYARDLYNKFQRLYQGSKSVTEYHKVMESQEVTMARFLHGLNRGIQDIVELYYYHFLEDLIHKATKVELQLKKKPTSRKPYPKKERARKYKSPKKGSEPLSVLGKRHIASQCTNIRTMVLREKGEVESESSQEKSSSSSDVESSSEASYYKGDLSMVRILMSNLVEEETKIERENIFHSSKRGKILVDMQVALAFTLGYYKNEIVLMWFPLKLHTLSWQYDRRVAHGGVTNRFTFEHLGHKVVFNLCLQRKCVRMKLK
ncbi:hypothetical protein CR513_55982, partial [Mucuna pruriens]